MKWPTSANRLFRRRTPWSEEQPALLEGNHKFDESSGQIYTERTISIQGKEDRNWTRPQKIPRKTPNLDPRSVTPVKGARSLQDAAIEFILANLNDLTFEGIDCLPRQQVLQIWGRATERFEVPFSIWAIFSKVLQNGNDIPLNLLRYREAIEYPRFTLHSYTTALTSTNFDFLASLSITTAFTVPDLVKLSSIKNLGVLEIVHTAEWRGPSGVSDRLMRTWHEAAIADGAFTVLRILKLWNHTELSGKSLSYLNRFPALALFDVRGCNFNPESRAHAALLGWKSTLDVGTLALFEATCVERAMLMRVSDNIEKNSKPLRKAPGHQLQDESIIQRLPRADVPAFLIDPSRSTGQNSSDCIPIWSKFQNYIDIRQSRRQDGPDIRLQNDRWTFMNHPDLNKSYNNETWEFDTYTIFSKIGELRNDRDLARAGIATGDQVIVKDELVNSIPLASIRLGPSPDYLLPTRWNNPINSFYGSMYSDFADPKHSQLSRFTISWADYPHPEEDWVDAPLRPDPRNISFIRIKVPSSPASSPPQGPVVASGIRERGFPVPKRSSSTGSSSNRRGSKVIQNKKQKLEDVLGSFMREG